MQTIKKDLKFQSLSLNFDLSRRISSSSRSFSKKNLFLFLSFLLHQWIPKNISKEPQEGLLGKTESQTI